MATIPAEIHKTHSITRKPRAVPPKKTRIELAREFDELPRDALATSAQVAAFRNCSEAKLERDRWAGGGIPYVKDGRSVRYLKRVVLEHMEGKTMASTSDAKAA